MGSMVFVRKERKERREVENEDDHTTDYGPGDEVNLIFLRIFLTIFSKAVTIFLVRVGFKQLALLTSTPQCCNLSKALLNAQGSNLTKKVISRTDQNSLANLVSIFSRSRQVLTSDKNATLAPTAPSCRTLIHYMISFSLAPSLRQYRMAVGGGSSLRYSPIALRIIRSVGKSQSQIGWGEGEEEDGSLTYTLIYWFSSSCYSQRKLKRKLLSLPSSPIKQITCVQA